MPEVTPNEAETFITGNMNSRKVGEVVAVRADKLNAYIRM